MKAYSSMNRQLEKKLDKIEGGQHDETSELFSWERPDANKEDLKWIQYLLEIIL